MHRFVTTRSAACLTLFISGGLLAGLSQNAIADPVPAPTVEAPIQAALQPSAPVIKLGSAILQEQTTFSDGSVHRETIIDQQPACSARAMPPSAVRNSSKT